MKRYPIQPVGVMAWLAVVGLASVTGCRSVGPNYQVPELEVPVAWQTPVGESDAALDEWWQVFGDAALEALVIDARERNGDLRIAVERLASAAAAFGMTRADLFPAARLEGNTDWARISERVRNPSQTALPDNPYWLYQTGFTLEWELDVWGRVRRRLEAARSELDGSMEDLRNVQVLLQSRVALEYIRLRTAGERMRAAQGNIELQRLTLELVQDRFRAGLGRELDVRQAEMNLAATSASLPVFRTEQAQALNALSYLTGRLPGSQDHLLAASGVPRAETLPGILPAELLRRRPDIRSAERALAAQTAKIGVAQAELYPTFALNGSFAFAASQAGDWFSAPARQHRAGPVITWPVFTAGKLRNRMRAEEAAARAALAEYERVVLNAYRECEDALAAHQNAAERTARLREAVQAARQAVELVADTYQRGLIDFQAVLDAQRQLALHQDMLAQAEGQLAANLVEIYKAFGGGWTPP